MPRSPLARALDPVRDLVRGWLFPFPAAGAGRARPLDLASQVQLKLGDYTMCLVPEDPVCTQILRDRTYEPHVSRVVREHLKPGMTVLDVGANVGWFTCLAAHLVGAGGRVIAIEPNPQNVQLLCGSIVTNHWESRVTLLPIAASNGRGILRFINEGSNGGVVTEHSKDPAFAMLVPASPLDELLGDAQVSFMKIDVEAHEPFAIRGAERLIRRCRPTLVTEFHPWAMRINNLETPEAYLKQLLDLGYRLWVIDAQGQTHAAADANAVMAAYKASGDETKHLDLLCTPA